MKSLKLIFFKNSEYDQEIHNHKQQTTLWHREEEPLNHHETPGRQIKQSNQLSLPHQDDCNTRKDTKQRSTKHRTVTDSHNGYNNKQKKTSLCANSNLFEMACRQQKLNVYYL